MRFAWLLLVGCASSNTIPTRVDLERPEPPPATFRWALDPLTCDTNGEFRSTVDTCGGLHSLDRYLVAAFAPISDDDPRIVVIRYDGEHIGAPLRWQQHLDFGAAPHSAVVTIVRDTAIASAISNGGIARVVAIDLTTGSILGRKTIAEHARSVQLEGESDYARIHVRTASGGVVAVMHPRTTQVIAKRVVDEAAFVENAEHVARAGDEANAADVTLRWEANRLVLRRDAAWFTYLRTADKADERALQRVTLARRGDRVIATVHDNRDWRIEVFAFDHATGKRLWRRTVTGGARTAFMKAAVGVAVFDDQVVVVADGFEKFACTIGLVDGIERACVDRLLRERVFDFGEDSIITP